MSHPIGFNKPYFTGHETEYIRHAVASSKISGDGMFTKKCHEFFEKRYNFPKVLLTTSCTDALEMAAILLDIKEGDEVIMPSFTFVSTANAFILRGGNIVFADSMPDDPNMDLSKIEGLITSKTKVIVVVHYAGVANDMDVVMDIAKRHNLFVVEDAAQAIDSYYKGRSLGSIGHLAAFSFHETKNIMSGEGGMLVINDERFMHRAEIIREKGTNRSAFFRGEVDKYGWVDIGSSFLPSEIVAAFLFAQLENIDAIQTRRKQIWKMYHEQLSELRDEGLIRFQDVPDYATNNAHMFYIICRDLKTRTLLIAYLKSKQIDPVFHYISLHKSPFYVSRYKGPELINSDHFTNCLLRLPMFFELEEQDVKRICSEIKHFLMPETSSGI